MDLFTGSNPKTDKGAALGYLTAVLHLAPANLAGRGTVCPWSTPGCRAGCLNRAGRGGIIRKGETTNAIQECRIRRARWYADDRAGFLARLSHEVGLHVRRAERAGLKPCVRLNGTSDIPWEIVAPDIFRAFPDVAFYDYTKSAERVLRSLSGNPWPDNYDLTYSWGGLPSAVECADVLDAGGRVAVPFAPRVPVGSVAGFYQPSGSDALAGIRMQPIRILSDPRIGREYPGQQWWRVVDGDVSDLRFIEPGGIVVGLKAKGPARRDMSGFVVRPTEGTKS